MTNNNEIIGKLMDENLLLTTMISCIVKEFAETQLAALKAIGVTDISLDEEYRDLIVDAEAVAKDIIAHNETGDTYTLEDLKQGYMPEDNRDNIIEPEDEDITPIFSIQDMLDWEDHHGD